MKKITSKKAQAYFRGEGYGCPACGEPNIDGGFVSVEEGRAHQDCTCLLCGAKWTDCYGLDALITSEGDIFEK